MNKWARIGAPLLFVLGLGAMVAGLATGGQGFAPQGVLTIPNQAGVLRKAAAGYAAARAEAGSFEISSAAVLDRLLAGQPVTLVDVRPVADFEDAHLAGALSLPLGKLLAAAGQVELPAGPPVVVVDDDGSAAFEGMVFLRLAGQPALAMTGGLGEVRRALARPEGTLLAAPRLAERLPEIAALFTGGAGAGVTIPAAPAAPPAPRKSTGRREGC